MKTSRKILVIGGGGYIGSVLCTDLLSSGHFVRSLDLFLYGNQSSHASIADHPHFECVAGDFTDENVLIASLAGITDVIFLGGLVGDPITKKYPEESRKINWDGVSNALRIFNGRKLNRIVFISTCSNYGLCDTDQVVDEESALNPLSDYAKAKVSAEKLILSLKGRVDYHATLLRFATAFGISPRMRFDLTVNEFARELFMGKELLVYDPATWRPYCHVSDFTRAILMVLEAPTFLINFEVFNAGGDSNNFTKEMIVREICRLLPKSSVTLKEKGSDPRNYRVSFEKIKRQLGFVPNYSVRDGIRELLRALQHGYFGDAEKNRNFYGNYEIHYPVKHDHST